MGEWLSPGRPWGFENVSEPGAPCAHTEQRPRKDHSEYFGLISSFAEGFMSLQRNRNKNLFQYKTYFLKKHCQHGIF